MKKHVTPHSLKQVLSLLMVLTCALSLLHYNSTSAAGKIKSTAVEVSATAVTLGIGDIASLTAKMTPTNSTDSMTWSSSSKKVATVTANGVVTAVKAGTATITVKTSSRKKATCKITVKEYLTKAEAINLIASNTLSQDDVLQMIQDYSLSREEIVALIQENSVSLSEETIIQLVKDNSLTEEDVLTLITNHSLSEKKVQAMIDASVISKEEIQNIVQENTLSEEDVLGLIQENTLSQDSVLKIIQDNTLNQDSVLKMIQDNTLSAEDVQTMIDTATTKEDFEDGVVLPLVTCDSDQHSPLTLPLTKEHMYISHEGSEKEHWADVTLTHVKVQKYHNDSFHHPFKYKIELDGYMNEFISDDAFSFGVYLTVDSISFNEHIASPSFHRNYEITSNKNIDEVVVQIYSYDDVDNYYDYLH